MWLKKGSSKILCVALIILVGAQTRAHGEPLMTLAQYHQNIDEAIKHLDTLATLCEQISAAEHREPSAPADALDTLPPLLPDTEIKTGREVRRLLPSAARIAWDGEGLDIDNRWVHTALEDYQQKSDASAENSTRAAMVRNLIQRLSALDERLDEVETASKSAPQARDREAEKGRLAAILRGPEFNKQKASGSALKNLIQRLKKQISDLFPDFKPLIPSASPGITRAAQIFIFTLTFALVAFLIWRHWRKHGGKLKRVSIREARVVLGEHLAPEQTAADLLAESETLARSGDLRGAIRKAYVALLCELGDRKIIRLAQHKTNRDYLQAVRKLKTPPELYQEMQPLTLNFERHWYGRENASESDWDNFRARCRQILGLK